MMLRSENGQMSESFLLGSVLAVVGGFLDAYTYIARGHVFANAQTGNIVFLGISFINQEYDRLFYYSMPILAFVCGVVISELVRHRFRNDSKVHWRQIIIVFEVIILIFVAFIPQGEGDILANIVISFICSMQVESFRKVNGKAVATTMCTGNLRSGVELCCYYYQIKDKKELHKALEYFGIIFFFICGAALGTHFTTLYLEKAVLLCCLLLVLAFAAMSINLPPAKKSKYKA